MSEFESFPKIARLSRDCTVTEKINGANGQIYIQRLLADPPAFLHATATVSYDGGDYAVFAGSRNRWVTPGKTTDNYGFAGWVASFADELVIGLGEGRHYGEWWGAGIQCGYNQRDKHFSLFNTSRWSYHTPAPACCSVVPVLYSGEFRTEAVDACLNQLRTTGSRAAPHFPSPEGVVVYHSAARLYFKKTLESDHEPKAIEARQVTPGVWDAGDAGAVAA